MASIKALAAIALTLVIIIPIGAGYLMGTNQEEVKAWETSESSSITDMLLNTTTPYYSSSTQTTNNTNLLEGGYKVLSPVFVSQSSKVSSYPSYVESENDITIEANGRYTIASGSFILPAGIAIAYSVPVEGTEYYKSISYSSVFDQTIIFEDGVLEIVSEKTVYNISSLTIDNPTSSAVTITISGKIVDASKYGDVTAGWTLPETSEEYEYYNPGEYAWYNYSVNNSVTFMLKMDAGQNATFRANIYTSDSISIASDSSGMVTVNGSELGKYTYLKVVYGVDQMTVYGLASWPDFSATPTTYNSITLDVSRGTLYQGKDFEQILISGSAVFRCDNAQVYAGTYPITKNFTFDSKELYPGQNVSIRLNSIAVYGETFGINGTDYTVTNGKITINGTNYAIREAVLSSWANDDGTYSIRINGQEIEDSANPLSVYFGGLWSVTATAYKLQETTETQLVWHAGQFGLDKGGIAAAGLISAGLLLIALGIVGRNSGVKIALLLLICGGAALIYLTLV